MVVFVFKIIEGNRSVLQALEGRIAFYDFKVEALAKSVVETAWIEILQIVICTSCKETVVIEIRYLVTVGCHDGRSQGAKVIRLTFVSLIIEGSAIMSQL